MAFPGELNIRYYQGDTYEFNVYPKQNDGTPFSLAGYTSKFKIGETRGSSADSLIEAYSSISGDSTHIKCAIRTGDSQNLDPDKVYVYDVEITKSATPYRKIHTLLTGNINITKQVAIGNSTDNANNYYKVIYIDNYPTVGKIPQDTNLYVTGQSATVLSGTISRPGYTFAGWNTVEFPNTDSGSPDYNPGIAYSAGSQAAIGTVDLILYSQWTEA